LFGVGFQPEVRQNHSLEMLKLFHEMDDVQAPANEDRVMVEKKGTGN
jgi:hypothetical protein